jgi:crotonobetainyl-CoA:carnitine CoA-transferase CaiB-like acyl-CoA transferase
MVQTVPHPHHGALPLVASPMKLSATPVQLRRPPPLLGQHSDEVLAEVGLSAPEVAVLRALGVVGPRPAITASALGDGEAAA